MSSSRSFRSLSGPARGGARGHRALPAGRIVSNWIAITIGDVTGIGPEVTLKAIAAELPRSDWSYLLIGDHHCLEDLNSRLALDLKLTPFENYKQTTRIAVHSPAA